MSSAHPVPDYWIAIDKPNRSAVPNFALRCLQPSMDLVGKRFADFSEDGAL